MKTIPEDWAGNKYTYADGAFALNPDWTDPVEEAQTKRLRNA